MFCYFFRIYTRVMHYLIHCCLSSLISPFGSTVFPVCTWNLLNSASSLAVILTEDWWFITSFFPSIQSIHSHIMNKRPTNASKNQYISTLIHSYMFWRIRGAIFREFSMSLLNCCPMWKRNGMRAVYCDCLCGGMLWDEGCILWLSVWWDVMGWGLYIVTVCVVGCYCYWDISVTVTDMLLVYYCYLFVTVTWMLLLLECYCYLDVTVTLPLLGCYCYLNVTGRLLLLGCYGYFEVTGMLLLLVCYCYLDVTVTGMLLLLRC
jgi:hypothetical protein